MCSCWVMSWLAPSSSLLSSGQKARSHIFGLLWLVDFLMTFLILSHRIRSNHFKTINHGFNFSPKFPRSFQSYLFGFQTSLPRQQVWLEPKLSCSRLSQTSLRRQTICLELGPLFPRPACSSSWIGAWDLCLEPCLSSKTARLAQWCRTVVSRARSEAEKCASQRFWSSDWWSLPTCWAHRAHRRLASRRRGTAQLFGSLHCLGCHSGEYWQRGRKVVRAWFWSSSSLYYQ